MIFTLSLYLYCFSFIVDFIELNWCIETIALVWLKRIFALLRYCTCKDGLLVCCLVLLASPCPLLDFAFLLPSGFRVSLTRFLYWVGKICVKAQHFIRSFFLAARSPSLPGCGRFLLWAARG